MFVWARHNRALRLHAAAEAIGESLSHIAVCGLPFRSTANGLSVIKRNSISTFKSATDKKCREVMINDSNFQKWLCLKSVGCALLFVAK